MVVHDVHHLYDVSAVARLTSQFQSQARAAGWEPGPDDIIYRAWIALGETDAQADEIRARFLPRTAGAAPEAPVPAPGFGIGSVRFCGGPETVIEQVRAFHEATGVGVLDLSFGRASQEMTLGAIRRFGEKVLPGIRTLSPSPV